MPEIDVVVLGDGLNALGVVRSLGKHGLGVALVSRSAAAIPAYSRFVKRNVVLDSDDCHPRSILEKVDLSPQEAMLFLTEELDVAACLQGVDAWRDNFRTYFHTPEIALAIMRKSEFDRLAREQGAPLPATVVVDRSTSVTQLDELRYPMVVKPSVRDNSFDARFRKAYKVETRQELAELFGQLNETRVELVVQEWIEGRDIDIYFNLVYVDEEGTLCGAFVGQKILCWPPRVGGTASCVAAPEHHDELTAITMDFLRGIGFRGLIGMEYKRDTRDGCFYMIEPTIYRTDYQHEIATLSGLEFLPGVYHRCMGRRGPFQTPYQRKSYWVDFPAARYSAKTQEDPGRPNPGSRRVDAYFRVSDLMPGLVHYGRYVYARIRRLVKNDPDRTGNKTGNASNA
jgi:D-aspartate ligase